MPNKLSQFWKELKRRNVIRVITVYAGAAFVILELVSMSEEPFGLPEWTFVLAAILLAVGFLIAIIISWIYDIHPEGGMVKTEPAHKVKEKDIPKSSNGWKIASYVSFVVILGLIILNVIPRTGKQEIIDKSIAVLPFKSLSNDPEKQYLADGAMDAIILHLSKIEDLRVMARTSVEQYRGTEKTATIICQELNVSYLLEGSFQKYGDQARLIVQLIRPGMEGHMWASEYDRDWKDIFSVQSEVAQTIARELQAAITPDEKKLIEKIPTASLTAYDFYQRGRENYIQYRLDDDNIEAKNRAEDLYHKALDYDSTFAQAYTGLAELYWYKRYWIDYVSEAFLDSMLNLADIALSFDNQLAEAYVLRGNYYERYRKYRQALNEYDNAIRYNPNLYEVYFFKGYLYYRDSDWVRAIDNYNIAASMERGPLLPEIFRTLGNVYSMIGFREKSEFYDNEALKLDDDSAKYYWKLAATEETDGNFEKAIELGKKSYAIDSTDENVLFRLGVCHSFLGFNEEYLEYLKKYNKRIERRDMPALTFRLGHAFWVNGFQEEAEYYLNEGLRINNEMLESDRHYMTDYITCYILAGGHAFLGDSEMAYEYLRLMNQKPSMPKWMIKDLNNDPMFDNIRNEPEFQQIIRDVEAKYQAEHKRVRQWLEENDML